jgi:aspartyl protease family protein
MRRISLIGVLLALATSSSAQAPSTHVASTLRPFVGETMEQFEARKRGLPPPPRSSDTTLFPDRHGHYLADAVINGRKVRVLVDTGASYVALARSDAEFLGVKSTSATRYKMSTANGVTLAAPVRLDEVQIGEVGLRDVDAVVHTEGGPSVTLLGMSFLSRLSGFETARGRLILRQ